MNNTVLTCARLFGVRLAWIGLGFGALLAAGAI
jgi:hypothetical protein